MQILIAEDDTTSRLLLDATLRFFSHTTISCRDGREAWELFQKDYFPVLITDWMMPRMSGLDLCKAIRSVYRERYTYIILLTVLGGKDNYLAGMESGADDFLSKPFDEDLLLARLKAAERILELHHHVRRLEGILNICAYCKKIKKNEKEWQSVDTFVMQHSEVLFSHDACPDCSRKVLDKLDAEEKAGGLYLSLAPMPAPAP